jgi:DNA-directed RNA polymerase specialized sigma24 family protein
LTPESKNIFEKARLEGKFKVIKPGSELWAEDEFSDSGNAERKTGFIKKDNKESPYFFVSCLERLDDPFKTVLQLYYYHDMSMNQITKHMKCSTNLTARELINTCLSRFRKLYNEELNNLK